MRFLRVVYLITTLLIILVSASACAPSSTPTLEANTGGDATEPQFADFDPNNFSNSAVIDNQWLPMKPGTQWVYEGTALDDEGNSIARRIEFTVTDLTKVIESVRTVVGWIEDFNDGKLVEKEIAFYAQDNDGNVWYLGEHPEDYEDGKFLASPTWIVGLEDARAGIKMWAEPKIGGPVVYQGWGPAVEWSDFGQVEQLGQETCVPVDCYKDVLVNVESSLGETGAFQIKYYARDVGEVRVGWRGADETKEELELVEYRQLNPEDLAEVHANALEVEKHAYEVSDVYRQTLPVEYPEGTPAIDISKIPIPEPTQSTSASAGSASDIIVYASDLSQDALSELDFYDDPASPGGKFISLPNNGDELDPPPENDPHVTFSVQVQSGIAYRCWVHLKVGTPKGRSQANTVWVQFTDAVDGTNQEILAPGSGSYLTVEGPSQEGWTWVECDRADSDVDSLVYFQKSGEVTVRIQAGSEGVGFDQFLLSPGEFLDAPPSDAVIEK